MSEPSPPPPKKRAWFQLHLSTCVVLMLAAALLLAVNLTPAIEKNSDFYGSAFVAHYGWPLSFRDEGTYFDKPNEMFQPFIISSSADRWSWPRFGLSVLACLAILAATAVLCEALIRRRDRRANRHPCLTTE